MMKPVRPTGVTILAILDLLGGILALLGGVFLVGVGRAGVMTRLGYGMYEGFIAGVGGVALVVGLFAILVGWGLWSGKDWAWVLAIVLYALGLLFSLVSLVGQPIRGVIGIVVYAFLLWYLFRPTVKAFFGRGTPSQLAPAMQPTPPAATA